MHEIPRLRSVSIAGSNVLSLGGDVVRIGFSSAVSPSVLASIQRACVVSVLG
jgi:hypothetical protein